MLVAECMLKSFKMACARCQGFAGEDIGSFTVEKAVDVLYAGLVIGHAVGDHGVGGRTNDARAKDLNVNCAPRVPVGRHDWIFEIGYAVPRSRRSICNIAAAFVVHRCERAGASKAGA